MLSSSAPVIPSITPISDMGGIICAQEAAPAPSSRSARMPAFMVFLFTFIRFLLSLSIWFESVEAAARAASTFQ